MKFIIAKVLLTWVGSLNTLLKRFKNNLQTYKFVDMRLSNWSQNYMKHCQCCDKLLEQSDLCWCRFDNATNQQVRCPANDEFDGEAEFS